jgi:hypothetical protein
MTEHGANTHGTNMAAVESPMNVSKELIAVIPNGFHSTPSPTGMHVDWAEPN